MTSGKPPLWISNRFMEVLQHLSSYPPLSPNALSQTWCCHISITLRRLGVYEWIQVWKSPWCLRANSQLTSYYVSMQQQTASYLLSTASYTHRRRMRQSSLSKHDTKLPPASHDHRDNLRGDIPPSHTCWCTRPRIRPCHHPKAQKLKNGHLVASHCLYYSIHEAFLGWRCFEPKWNSSLAPGGMRATNLLPQLDAFLIVHLLTFATSFSMRERIVVVGLRPLITMTNVGFFNSVEHHHFAELSYHKRKTVRGGCWNCVKNAIHGNRSPNASHVA